MKRILARLGLRDPIWQGVGAILAIMSIALSVIVAYDIYQRSTQSAELSYTKQFYFNLLPFDDATEGKEIGLTINGVPVQSGLRIAYYSLSNSGSTAIRPEDYIKPIQVSVDEPWQPITAISGSTTPANLDVNWTRVTTNTFQMEPALLNPQDKIELLLFLIKADSPKTEQMVEPKIHWNARIANVKALKEIPASEADSNLLSVSIYHYGWRVYALIGLALFVFGFTTWAGVKSNRLDYLSLSRILLLTTLAGFAFATSEILVDTAAGGYMAPVELMIIAVHFILLLYLILPMIQKKTLAKKTPMT